MTAKISIAKRNILGAVESLLVEDHPSRIESISLTRDESRSDPEWIGRQGMTYAALHFEAALDGHKVQDMLEINGVDIIETKHDGLGYRIQVINTELPRALRLMKEFSEEDVLKVEKMQKEAAEARKAYMENLTPLHRQLLERDDIREDPEAVRRELQNVLNRASQMRG